MDDTLIYKRRSCIFPTIPINAICLGRVENRLLASDSSFSGTPANKIWIVGDSLVRQARERVLHCNFQDLGRPRGSIQRWGQGGASLQDLKHMIENRLYGGQQTPRMIIIYLGTINIGRDDACRCRLEIDHALQALRSKLPNTHIAWSPTIPRLLYYSPRPGSSSQRALDGARKSLINTPRDSCPGCRTHQ